ncbi:MAG: putative esterase of the alpha-beta hydrolase superfamily [Bacteroidetes bacterium]|nr:putative esterase of the alpha-beta hydrolase superfamily [Bacteroidota bacterium]
MNKKVQLVLGSGGARGLAHIGVIEMLLQDGYEIVEVAGCSMGAVIGGMYCAGYLSEYREWLSKLNKHDVYRLFDLTFSPHGLVKGERIFDVLKHITGEQVIENLPVPFTAVATDMLGRSEVHFKSGNLYRALRASTGIPGVFTPVSEDQYLFVDGGVLNPLPINLMKRQDDTIIVAVNLNGAFVNEVVSTGSPESAGFVETAKQDLFSRLRHYFSAREKDTIKTQIAAPVTFSMFELLNASYDSTLDRVVELTLALNHVDILIEIPRNVCAVFDFHRTAELIDIGKNAYTDAMDKFKRSKNVSL